MKPNSRFTTDSAEDSEVLRVDHHGLVRDARFGHREPQELPHGQRGRLQVQVCDALVRHDPVEVDVQDVAPVLDLLLGCVGQRC